jgi:hypothetical protein
MELRCRIEFGSLHCLHLNLRRFLPGGEAPRIFYVISAPFFAAARRFLADSFPSCRILREITAVFSGDPSISARSDALQIKRVPLQRRDLMSPRLIAL